MMETNQLEQEELQGQMQEAESLHVKNTKANKKDGTDVELEGLLNSNTENEDLEGKQPNEPILNQNEDLEVKRPNEPVLNQNEDLNGKQPVEPILNQNEDLEVKRPNEPVLNQDFKDAIECVVVVNEDLQGKQPDEPILNQNEDLQGKQPNEPVLNQKNEDKKFHKKVVEIQTNPHVKGCLLDYNTFHGEKIKKECVVKVEKNIRVIRKTCTNDKDKAVDLGIIVEVDKDDTVTVKWAGHDRIYQDEKFEKKENNQYDLLLFDYAQIGIAHDEHFCNGCPKEPIQGIRWCCVNCDDYNLCTYCYINDKHDLDHEFKRYLSKNSKSHRVQARRDTTNDSKVDTYYKKKKAAVELTTNSYNKYKGDVKDYNETDKCEINMIDVFWDGETEPEKRLIKDLKLKDRGIFSFYPEHLPVLAQRSDDCFKIRWKTEKRHKQIEVVIWRNIQKKTKRSVKPSLYLIFANPREDTSESEFALMAEVIRFAKKTELPCHIIGQRVLFYSVYSDTAYIHYKTNKATIEELIQRGYSKFVRGDIVETENENDEVNYFKQMAEYAIGEDVLPVIISVKNGGITKELTNSADQFDLPILRFKNNSKDVRVLWKTVNELRTDTKKPWRLKKHKHKHKQNPDDKWKNEIALISEIQYGYRKDALVCNLVIAGCIEKCKLDNSTAKTQGYQTGTHYYLTSMSMYLMQREEWYIPEELIENKIDQNSLEYIHEKVMTSELLKSLWHNQKSFLNMDYKLPKYRKLSYTETENKSGRWQSCFGKNEFDKEENRIQLIKWNSECYGLILFALLQKRYWTGATQLVANGYIGIHHILIGCVIIQDEINSWKTTESDKKMLQSLISSLTERAICIISRIYETDKKLEEDATKGKHMISSQEERQSPTEQKDLGDYINHAGRLLLNHGYLRDAINTENNVFLGNDTVKKILNKKWYGTEKVNYQTIFSFILLAIVHIFVLPFLMINMEFPPLLWLYKKYKLPFLKVAIHMLGFLVLLVAYAYMLLFDYSDDGISNTDWFIISWFASFFVAEIKQVTVACIRGKKKSYICDWWNILDWLLIIVYTSGMLLRAGEGSNFKTSSKCLLVSVFMLQCLRILNLCCMTEFLGPKLVIARKMIHDTIAFMIIMTIIMVWYSVSGYALLYPNSVFNMRQMEHILSNGYWTLFGELNLDGDALTVPYCTFNRTIYETGSLQRCPTQLGLHIMPYLKAFYVLIAVVLLLNLLIAIYSDTFNVVQQKSEYYWRQIQTDFFEEYSIKTIFPIHLQLLALPGILLAILWYCYRSLRECSHEKNTKKTELNHQPMIVRVFLYNTNYDLKLKSTEEAEKKGRQAFKRTKVFEHTEKVKTMHKLEKIEDTLNEMNKKSETETLKTELKKEKEERRKLMNKLEKMGSSLKEFQTTIKRFNKDNKKKTFQGAI